MHARVYTQVIKIIMYTQQTFFLLLLINSNLHQSNAQILGNTNSILFITIINPRVKITVLVLCVCVRTPYSSKPSNNASYQKSQWLQLDITKKNMKMFSIKMLRSEVMGVFSQLNFQVQRGIHWNCSSGLHFNDRAF